MIELPNYKFLVLKWDDINSYLSEDEFKRLDVLMGKIEEARELEGKERCNDYLVINTDEPYAPKIVEIMKKNNHWG